MGRVFRILFLLFIVLQSFCLFSHNVGVSAVDTAVFLPDNFWVYKGADDLSVEQVLQMPADSGEYVGKDELCFNFFNSYVWCRFTLHNTTDDDVSRLLHISTADVQIINLYKIEGDKVVGLQKAGKSTPFKLKDIKSGTPVFKVDAPVKGTSEYLLKVFKLGGAIVLPMDLLTYKEFYNQDRANSDKNVFMYGLQVFAILFNLFLLIILRKKLYLKYTLYVLFSILSVSGLTGYANKYLWPDFTWIAERETVFFNYYALAFLILFVQEYLDLKKILPRVNRVMAVFVWGLVAISSLSFMSYKLLSVAIVISNLTTLVGFVAVITICFMAIKFHRLRAVYILISYVPLLLGVVAFFLRSAGVITSTFVVAGLDFAVTFQVLTIAFALVDSFRRAEAEKVEMIASANEKLSMLSLAARETDNAIAIYGPMGELQWCNRGFDSIMGLTESEHGRLYGESILKVCQNSDIGKYFEQCKKEFESVVFETDYVLSDGKVKWEQTTLTPVLNERQEVVNFVTVGSDLTAIKNKEEEKQQLQEQLLQSQKMETVGKLAGGIAHDFNNILTPIIGYAEIVASEFDSNSQTHQDLKVVLNAAQRARKLVRQILTFSRNFKEDARVMRLGDSIKEVFELVSSTMPANINMKLNNQSTSDLIYADPVQIQQVLMNLCANAFHAIDKEHGELTVEIQNELISADHLPVQLQNLSAGEYVHLTVTDNGYGMDKDTMSKLFDPFFTTKEVGKGTGLGLSVVHGIIIKYKGDIYYESIVGEGTAAHVYLPVCADGEVSAEEPLGLLSGFKGDGQRIMVVDDEENIAKLLSRILNDHGYNAAWFSDSENALCEYQNNPGKYNLVITDQAMPKLTGIELSREIVDVNQDAKIIVLTGYNDKIESIPLTKIGVRCVLIKPLSLNVMLEKVSAVLN